MDAKKLGRFRRKLRQKVVESIIGQGWYQHGKLHRYGNKPAINWPIRFQNWYRNGKLHREDDLPASIWVDGSATWYQLVGGLLPRRQQTPYQFWGN